MSSYRDMSIELILSSSLDCIPFDLFSPLKSLLLFKIDMYILPTVINRWRKVSYKIGRAMLRVNALVKTIVIGDATKLSTSCCPYTQHTQYTNAKSNIYSI